MTTVFVVDPRRSMESVDSDVLSPHTPSVVKKCMRLLAGDVERGLGVHEQRNDQAVQT